MKAIPIGLQGAAPNAEDERPGVAERYTSAATSSHLKVEAERCDVDYLMAAAKANPLGVLLWRLRAEFDGVRREIRPEGELNLAERLLVLSGLRSLHGCRQALWSATLVKMAAESPFGVDREQARIVVGRVLDAWLDPTCSGCDGRGFNGGTHRGEQKVSCRACRGVGTRRAGIGVSVQERLLANWLAAYIGEQMFSAEVEVKTALQAHFAV
jgi:hypothetical protein